MVGVTPSYRPVRAVTIFTAANRPMQLIQINAFISILLTRAGSSVYGLLISISQGVAPLTE